MAARRKVGGRWAVSLAGLLRRDGGVLGCWGSVTTRLYCAVLYEVCHPRNWSGRLVLVCLVQDWSGLQVRRLP